MKYLVAFCLSLLFVTSCKKGPAGPQGPDGPKGPNGPIGSTPTGIITGSVTQFDEYGNLQLTSLNAVTVSAKGTNLSTVTNEKGIYSLSTVPAGIYVLEFKGPNTQTYKNTQVSFAGRGTLYVDATIYNKPTWTFTNLYLRDTVVGSHYMRVTATVTSSTLTPSRSFLILFGKNANMDNIDPGSYDYLFYTTTTSFYIPYNQLLLNDYTYHTPGYPSGTIYYAKVYAINSGVPRYLDAATQQFVYYSVSNQAPVTFTLTMP